MLEACLDSLTLAVTDGINSLQHSVNQGFEEQALQLRGFQPTSVDEDCEFKVVISCEPRLIELTLTLAQSRIKSHAERLLHSNGAFPYRLDIPTVVEILDFRKGVHRGPTVDRIRIEITSRSNSLWNLRACQVFAQGFCAVGYPESEGKSLVDISHEFCRLIPAFVSRHATECGFADTRSYEKFQELKATHIRRHRVISTLSLTRPQTYHPIVGRIPTSSCQRSAGTSRVPAHHPSPG